MKREEILKKSRLEDCDEGKEYIEGRGRYYGEIVFAILAAILMIYNLFHGHTNHQVFTLFWGFLAAEGFGKYRTGKSKGELIVTICAGVASICYLILSIMSPTP
ncbi:conserved protein of unknown function [Ruminococcaceae bacterium BL-4]|nr:conserved protein of unknown function [Ruminococcaceae bacterium BL-4]